MYHPVEIGEREPPLSQTNVIIKQLCSRTINSLLTSMSASSDCFFCLKILVAKKLPSIALYPTISRLCNAGCLALTAMPRLVRSSIHRVIGCGLPSFNRSNLRPNPILPMTSYAISHCNISYVHIQMSHDRLTKVIC
jgi:hypothetical protein